MSMRSARSAVAGCTDPTLDVSHIERDTLCCTHTLRHSTLVVGFE